jgi:hypothetical protein
MGFSKLSTEIIFLDSAGLDPALHLSVFEDPDGAYLGESQLGTFDLVACLRVGIRERLVPTLTFEPWISRFLSSLNSSEERLECLIQPSQDILETMSIDTIEIAVLPLYSEHCSLIFIGSADAFNLIGILSVSQGFVIEMPTSFKSQI